MPAQSLAAASVCEVRTPIAEACINACAGRPSSFVADPFLWLSDGPDDPWHMFYETKTTATMQVCHTSALLILSHPSRATCKPCH